MARLLVGAFCLALTSFAPQSTALAPLVDTETVFSDTSAATATALYHRHGCASLQNGRATPLELREAKSRYFQPHCLCVVGQNVAPPCPVLALPSSSTPPLPNAIASSATTTAAAVPVAATVYVTRTGEKYHRAGCRSLAKSSMPMALNQVAERYGACRICRPPVPGTVIAGAAAPEPVERTTATPARADHD